MILAVAIGCKTNRIKNKQPVGLWITTDTLDGAVYKTRGRYQRGSETRTWKFFKDDHLYKKQVYRDSLSKITFYHENGKKKFEGFTTLALEDKYYHWYYEGEWREFDSLGNFVRSRFYDKGELVN